MRNDIPLLFATRIIRMFGYGFLSVVLAMYLAQRGLTEGEIGLLLTLTLTGEAAVTLWITTSADRMSRRRMLIVGAQPHTFVPFHWDNFTRSLNKPLKRFARPGRIALWQLTRLARQILSGAQVIIPEIFREYTLK